MNALLLTLAVVAASAPSTRITAAARVEARASSLVDRIGHGGFEATPELSLRGRYGRLHVRAGYAPRLLLAYPTGVNPFQMGHVGLSYSPKVDHVVSLEQRGEYGFSDFVYRLPSTLDERKLRLGLAPRPRAIGDYLDSNTDLTYWARLAPLVTGSVSAGYSMSGGLSEASRRDVPFQQTPYLGAKVNVASSDIDTLVSQLNFERTALSNDNVFSIIRMSEEWHRTLRDGTRVFGGAGVAATRANWRPFDVFGLVRAGVNRDVPVGRRRVGLMLLGRMGPWVNPLTGMLVRRGEVLGGAQLAVTEDFRLRAFGGGGWAMFASTSQRERAMMTGGDVSFRVMHDFSLFGGGIVQRFVHPSYPHLPSMHWTVSAGVRWQQDDRFGIHL